LKLAAIPAVTAGVGSVLLNFNGDDGDRTYTGDDGRAWTFIGTTGVNEIDIDAGAKWHSTSYLFGTDGAPDADCLSLNVQAENADFHPGTRDWYVRCWVNKADVSFTGVNELASIGALTGTNRCIRWHIINNAYACAYAEGGTNENTFPSFGASPIDDLWHEVVFERVGNSIFCYEDGVQSGGTFDCTGDDIGVLNLSDDRLVVLGASISAGTYDFTPDGGSMDAFEMKIGENIYGGVAPGSAQTLPPAAEGDQFEFGQLTIQPRIFGSYPIIDGDLEVTGNVNVGGELTGVANELPVLSPAGTGSINLEWRTEFNPQLVFAKAGAAAEIVAPGQMHFFTAPVFQIHSAGAGTSYMEVAHNGVRGIIRNNTTGSYIECTANNGSEDFRFAFGTGIMIQEKATAHAPVAAFGQFWVQTATPCRAMFTDDAGNDVVLGDSSTTVLPVYNGVADAFIDVNWAIGDFNPELDLGSAKTGGAGIIRTPNLLQFNLTALATGTWQFMAGPDNLSPHFAISHTGTFCTLGTSTVSGGDIVMFAENGAKNIVMGSGSCLAIVEQAAPNPDVLTRGQFWVDSADALPYFRDELGVDHALTGGGGIAAGTVDDAGLKWDTGGAAWIEETSVLLQGNGRLDLIGSPALLRLDAPGAASNETTTDIRMENFSGFVIQAITDAGSNSNFLLSANRTGVVWQNLQIQTSTEIFGSLYLDDTLGPLANLAGRGQLYVLAADDTLHYRTEAGVDTDLTASGATTFAALTDTDVAGVADHDMLFWDTAAGDWKDTAGLLTADVDGSTIGLTINNITSAKDGALVINDGTNILQSLRLATDTSIGAVTITTPLIGGTDIWVVARNGAQNLIVKVDEMRIAGAVPGTDYVAFSDDDVDFNTVGNSKVDWNINGFTGSMNITGMDLDLNANLLIEPVLADYSIQLDAQGTVTDANQTCVYSDGPVHSIDLENWTANRTITLSGFPAGYGQQTVRVVQDGTAARTITWAGATFNWRDDTAHVQNPTLNGISIYTFESWDGGTTIEAAGADYGP
jgi:hypothetical protein